MPDLDKLERLARLRDSGALSEVEYQRAKADVLAGHVAARTPLIVGAILAFIVLVGVVFAITRQTGEDIGNATLASSSRPAPSASRASVQPTPSPLPSPPQVDPPVPASAAPDPTNADYYNDAKRSMMKAYHNQPPGIRAMLGDWAGANELCRGSSDGATIDKWCPIRDAIDTKLRGMNMCYGRPTDQSAAESDWHTCDARDEDQSPN